jgi:hypothetical protein
MCDEDRGGRDGQGRFSWHIASRRTRLRRFSLHHPVECRSSKLAGTPYLPSLANHGARHQSKIYTRSAQEPFAVFLPSQAYRRSPSGSAAIAADPILSSRFRSVANHIRVAGVGGVVIRRQQPIRAEHYPSPRYDASKLRGLMLRRLGAGACAPESMAQERNANGNR